MYYIVVGLAMVLIVGLNILFNLTLFDGNVLYVSVLVVLSTIAVIVVDAVVATIIRHGLPNKWFAPDNKLFKVSKKEQHFYEKLGIRKWKDKALELGQFTGFRKNKLEDPYNLEYIERFLLENNYGFIVHVGCCIIGFVIILFFPLKFALFIGMPVAIVNVLLNLMSAFILRYNTPKLQTLRKYALRKKEQEKINDEKKGDSLLVA